MYRVFVSITLALFGLIVIFATLPTLVQADTCDRVLIKSVLRTLIPDDDLSEATLNAMVEIYCQKYADNEQVMERLRRIQDGNAGWFERFQEKIRLIKEQWANGQTDSELAETLAPVQEFLEDYADIANVVVSDTEETTETLWLEMIYDTTEGITVAETISENVPVDYYPDAPQTIRQYGYSYEALTSSDMSAMNALDFAAWLGWAVALPFLYLRSVQELGETIGPVGLFIAWLILAVFWVAWVQFMEFIISMASALLGLIGRVIQFIGIAKP